jgi:hypothetical protein
VMYPRVTVRFDAGILVGQQRATLLPGRNVHKFTQSHQVGLFASTQVYTKLIVILDGLVRL